MKNEFQIFDKENVLLNYLFEEIDEVIRNNGKIKKRCLKILSCYFGAEKFRSNGSETTILNKVRDECKARDIKIELILSKNIFNQNTEYLKGSKYFKAFPNKRDAFFHGKAIAYVHGSCKITTKNKEIKEAKMVSGDGILIVTSANISNAYLGNNSETGVLLKNKKSLESFLLEFEKAKGVKNKLNGSDDYNSLYDILSNGYMLFKDDYTTLNSVSTFHLPLKQNSESNAVVNRIGGALTEGNLSISIGKACYFNIDEFERGFVKPKNIFSKYSISTPFGLWINKLIYDEIINLHTPLLKNYRREIRDCFTNENIDDVSNKVLKSIVDSMEVMSLLENDVDEVKQKISDWNEELKEVLLDDSVIALMFFGFNSIEFPLDPNYTRTLQEFVKHTKKLNYKKEKAKSPTKNIKNILRPFIESENKDFSSFSQGIESLLITIKQDFKLKESNKISLSYNKPKSTNRLQTP